MSNRLRVITLAGDVHAGAVEWAVADRGVTTQWMCLRDFPAAATYSVAIQDSTSKDDFTGALPDETCDFVWIRRIGRSVGLPVELDERDRSLCQRESERFFGGLLHTLAPNAWWVNPLYSFMTSRNNKLYQLRVAQACGLKVPDTLASNDPIHIQKFFRAHRGKVIAKPFFPHLWSGADGRSHEYYSSLVSAGALRDPRVLQASPLIYQRFIDKLFEVRVAIFGRAVIAAKLDAKGDHELAIDWRHPSKRPTVEPFRLPQKVRECCHRVMKSLGLVHGSFDLIVQPDGEFVFLEVNEAGQCLWLEEDCPELPVLSSLVGLILHRSPDFSECDLPQYPYKLADFLTSSAYAEFRRRTNDDHLPMSMEGIVFAD
ncbi:MAG: hypothetical protein PF483_01160 [Halothiobacillus sp.]|jgi:hypothetical protein|nr:hypothetical protein [Halothiobacillus sp.]